MQYWDKRYGSGLTSGQGSIGAQREWKWSVIEKYADPVENVVDVGCGDLSFWEGRSCEKYFGIDISQVVIAKNRELRPSWRFRCQPAEEDAGVSGTIVICMDLLFHVLDEGSYAVILSNLTRYSEKWIFVHTWYQNPFGSAASRLKLSLKKMGRGEVRSAVSDLLSEGTSDGIYQKYRDFGKYLPQFRAGGFSLVAVERDPTASRFGAMHVFRKDDSLVPPA